MKNFSGWITVFGNSYSLLRVFSMASKSSSLRTVRSYWSRLRGLTSILPPWITALRMTLLEWRWHCNRFCRIRRHARHDVSRSGKTGQGQTPRGACQVPKWFNKTRKKSALGEWSCARMSASSGLSRHASNDVAVENFPCTVATSEFRICLVGIIKRILPV